MTSTSTLLTIKEVNSLPYDDFIQRFGNVVEHCPLFAAAVCQCRPFSDLDSIQNAFSKFMDDLPLSGKAGVLRLHPDLAGKLAVSGQLTSESTNEQSAAGLSSMTSDEREKMTSLNAKYKNKFDFPFVICARLNKKDAILKGLEERLENSTEEEAVTGSNEVKKIGYLRLKDIVDEKSRA